MTRPEGLLGPLVVDVRARDLRTDDSGTPHEVARFEARLSVDQMTGRVVEVVDGAGAGASDLVGVGLRSGFGRRLAELYPDDQATRSLRYSSLDDLGGAMLVSGYSLLAGGAFEPGGAFQQSADDAEARAASQADICMGWATGSPLLESYRIDGISPLPVGPAAPDLDHDADRVAWHELRPPGLHTVRRRRRLDLLPSPQGGAGGPRLRSHFRDSYAGDDGETVMHEYEVEADVDAEGRIARVVVAPRVLPWTECPGAVPSAQRAVGTALADLPALARSDLRGPTTCTHLTSTLRCLTDAIALERELASR